MLTRLSSAVLLKSVLAAIAALAVIAFGLRAWSAWTDLAASDRTRKVIEASGPAFTVLINQRTDRSTTMRTWNAAEPITEGNRAYLSKLRDAEMPALKETLARLDAVDFAGKATLLPALRRSEETLLRLQAEYWAGVVKPKSERRPKLADDYNTEGLQMQQTLESIARGLTSTIRYANPFVDQMLAVKQHAWSVRNLGGEASLLISTGLVAGRLPAEARQRYSFYSGGARASWDAIEDTIAGATLPDRFTTALAAAKRDFFAADYAATRERLLTALIDGAKPEMTADDWSPYTVPRLGAMQGVAEAALAEARENATTMHAAALSSLAIALAMLVGAIVVATLGAVVVSRRVIRPLGLLVEATRRQAAGDLTAEADVGERTDEIGALAAALVSFRIGAAEKAASEATQAGERARIADRQHAIEDEIARFEAEVGAALAALGAASTTMNGAAQNMSGIAGESAGHVREAAAAAQDASSNVAGIAAATEELSASIAEITRQVSNAAQITGRAVEETRQTDDTVRGLAESASRIGEVVKLISDIAGQTNLLALNATIEAARAGDAGKGFAVVASEVKSLANQTAKATEEIASQISAIRSVTEAAVVAIKQIGITIDEVSTVATAIAAGVEQQGASTEEIARNTQQAARRTRDVTDTIDVVAQGTTTTLSNTDTVGSAAADVDTQVAHLRTRIDGFLGSIRAA